MVAGGIVHVDWLNDNRNRRYPFVDSASLTDQSGTLTLPNELLVDLAFPTSGLEFDASGFYLRKLVVYSDGLVLVIGYVGSSDPVAERAVTRQQHFENRTYFLEGSGDFRDSVGRITIGRLDEIMRFGGEYTFAPDATRLLPTLLRPSVRGVVGLRVVSADGEESDLLQNDVELIAGANIVFDVLSVGDGNSRITVSAINNPDYEVECDCDDAGARPCIETVNGIGPDASGNIDLVGSGCLELSPHAGGLLLQDQCAEPCCGCAELDTLRSELARLNSQMVTQETFAGRALASIDQLTNAILATRTGVGIPCG